MLHFLKKIKKKTCRYHYQNLNDIISSSWDIEKNILELVILAPFLIFTPLKTPKINFIILHMYTKNRNLVQFLRYGARPTEFFVILGHFFAFLKYKVQQTEIFVILGHFLSFQPPDNLENQNLKIEKTPGVIIILHICTINDNCMMYGSWDMERNRQFFVILDRFCRFTTLWT